MASLSLCTTGSANNSPRVQFHDWGLVPRELLLSMANSLDSPSDLIALSSTCRVLRFLADCESIWKMFCMSTFNVSPDKNPPSWKDLYRFNHELLYTHILRGATNALQDLRFQPGRSTRIYLPA